MATEIKAADALPFPTDPVRTAIALTYMEPGQIADKVLPRLPVSQPEFEYKKFAKEDYYVLPDDSLGRTGEPTEVEFSGSEVHDKTEHHGLTDPVPATDQASAMGGGWDDPVNVAAAQLRHLLMLRRELRAARLVFNAASYGAGYKESLDDGDRFDDAGSDPIAKLLESAEKMVFKPDAVVFGQRAWTNFRLHPKVRSAVAPGSDDAGPATRQQAAELLEVDEVLVGSVRYATSKRKQDLVLARAWGGSTALIYRGAMSMSGMAADGGDQMMSMRGYPTFGFTAVFEDLVISTPFNPKRGAKGVTEVIARDSCKEVVAGGEAGFGYLLQTVVDD